MSKWKNQLLPRRVHMLLRLKKVSPTFGVPVEEAAVSRSATKLIKQLLLKQFKSGLKNQKPYTCAAANIPIPPHFAMEHIIRFNQRKMPADNYL